MTSPAHSDASHVRRGIDSLDLIKATLTDINVGLNQGLYTSHDLVKVYLARIEEVNSNVRAVLETNPDALQIAALRDTERANKQVRGPLHGIPILIKGNMSTADKMDNSAGSWLLVGSTVAQDATVVKKLRDAGAIILGKTNLSEWSCFRTRLPCDGWSPTGGQTYGAYCHHQSPSGSSSGSAVATDLGLAFAALGTETEGSITSPAHENGLVGIKPTVGYTSRHLVVPISEHQDTVGPIARTVWDATILMGIIAGKDEKDMGTLQQEAAPSFDVERICKLDALNGVRIGVPWNVIDLYLERSEDTTELTSLKGEVQAFREALDKMRRAGAVIVDSNFPKATELLDTPTRRVVMGADFLTALERYLAELEINPSHVTNLEEVREKTQKHEKETYPQITTEIWDEALERGFGNADPRAILARTELHEIAGPGCLLGTIDRHDLKAVVLPSDMAPRWTAAIGAPAVTVPLSHHPCTAPGRLQGSVVEMGPGTPFGICFLGNRGSDEDLISFAYAFEQMTKVRERPVKRVIEPTASIRDMKHL